MSIATLKLDQPAKLEFGVTITGADGAPKSRLIIEGPKFSISIPGKKVEEGVEVEIPQLKGILAPGEYKTKLEVVVEGKLFTPLQEKITFEPLVEVTAESAKAEIVTKESVQIKSILVKNVVNEIAEESEDSTNPVLEEKPSLFDANTKHVVTVTVSESTDSEQSIKKIKVGGETIVEAENRARQFYEKQGMLVHSSKYHSVAK